MWRTLKSSYFWIPLQKVQYSKAMAAKQQLFEQKSGKWRLPLNEQWCSGQFETNLISICVVINWTAAVQTTKRRRCGTANLSGEIDFTLGSPAKLKFYDGCREHFKTGGHKKYRLHYHSFTYRPFRRCGIAFLHFKSYPREKGNYSLLHQSG